MSFLGDYLLALGFMTRLGPARAAAPAELARTLRAFPAVGLTLGLLWVAPFALGLGRGLPWVQALLLAGWAFWLTRGLHDDGLADIGDAWGSGATGERFWAIVKDSRIGAFGVIALVLAYAGRIVLTQPLLAAGAWGGLLLAPVLGRLAALTLARLGRDLARPGLGGLFLAGATTPVLSAGIIQTCLVGLFAVPWGTLVLALVLVLAVDLGLSRLARREAGLNGDFLGTAATLGELAGLLAAVLTL